MRAVLPLVAAFLSAACGSEQPALVLEINFQGAVDFPAQVNAVSVELTGSRTAPDEQWLGCESAQRRFEVSSPDDLPLTVTVEAGDIYRRALAYRVGAQLVQGTGESEVVQVVHPGWTSWTSWPEAGSRVVRVTLDESCFGLVCAVGEHCVLSRCQAMPLANVFADTETSSREGSCLQP